MSAVVPPGPVDQTGPWLRIDRADPVFADRVWADLVRISRTASGRALFRTIRDAGVVVAIRKPSPPTQPPNAWTMRGADAVGDAVIAYDPADWPAADPFGAASSDAILFGRLGQCVPGGDP